MFSPQRRPLPGIPLTPRTQVNKVGATAVSNSRNTEGKGKAVAFLDGPMPPPPPVGLLSDGGGASIDEEEMDDWRRFREAGFLDEGAMERKDREALLEKAGRLEKELYDYQYNMGILLIEKKEWTLQYEELRQALEEAEEILKRERSTHLIALSEVEKRDENLRKALGYERQSLADLEKALRDLQDEHTSIKRASEIKLADAEAIKAGLKEKSMETDERLLSVNSKLDEINKRSSELDMKLEEVKARENLLQRERLSLNTEREAYEATLYKRKQEIHEWESNLQKGEDSLCELRRILSQKEEKANENDRILSQKEKDLEELEKKIDLSFSKFKERENSVSTQQSDLTIKEQKADSLRSVLETKGKELLKLEENLCARERVEVKELLDNHRGILNAKMQEFELDLEQKRKNIDEGLRSKVDMVKQREIEILHKEEKLTKQEQAFDGKTERVKVKERDLDAKFKTLKESEKFMKVEQKKLELGKQQLLSEKEDLHTLYDNCDKLKAEIAHQEQQISEKSENLKLMDKERTEYLHLQAELKQEFERSRRQVEFLLKDAEALKEEREKFEKEWQVLEEKRTQTRQELKEIVEERAELEKLQSMDGERLKKEEHATEQYIKEELEAVRLEKESFEARMRQENMVLSERAQIEHDQLMQDFELQRKKIETGLLSKQEEMEKRLQARVITFDEQRKRELHNINHLKDVAQKDLEGIKSERLAIEREKQEVAENNKKLEEQRFGISKDIDELNMLSEKLRDQREQLIKERSHFIMFVEKHKACENCADVTREFVLSDIQSPGVEDEETLPLPSVADHHFFRNNQGIGDAFGVTSMKTSPSNMRDTASAGNMSWIRKCTSKFFSISPTKKVENVAFPILPGCPSLPGGQATVQENSEASGIPVTDKSVRRSAGPVDESQPSFGTADDSINIKKLQDGMSREGDGGYSVSLDDHSHMDSKFQETPDESYQSEQKSSRRQPGRRRKAGPSRTRSVKAVVEEAKLFLGENAEEYEHNASSQPSDAGNGNQSVVEKAAGKVARKRPRAPTVSEQDAAESEGHSESVTVGGRRKRQQVMASAEQTPGQSRYNLRRHRNKGSTTQASSDLTRNGEEKGDGGARVQPKPSVETASMMSHGFATSEAEKSIKMAEVTTLKNADTAPDRAVRFEIAGTNDQAEVSEEVSGAPEFGIVGNVTSEYVDEDENGSIIHEGDDEEEYSEHPGEVSISKKLWTFFTT